MGERFDDLTAKLRAGERIMALADKHLGGLRSCDFTSAGCTDAECDYCYPRMSTRKLTNLAANLYAGAMLCAAYDLGYFEQGSPVPIWHPGCGTCAPGFEGKL